MLTRRAAFSPRFILRHAARSSRQIRSAALRVMDDGA